MSGTVSDHLQYLAALGISTDYGTDPPLPRYAEAKTLEDVGPNFAGRMQRLTPETATHWRRMQQAARYADIDLDLVSGFRSIAYQAQLLQNKLDAGDTIATILQVNAAPGFSQHHTGQALDLTTTDTKPLTEEFEDTAAFRWLMAHAADFGFNMPYGRDNQFGFCYEPWHWSRLEK